MNCLAHQLMDGGFCEYNLKHGRFSDNSVSSFRKWSFSYTLIHRIIHKFIKFVSLSLDNVHIKRKCFRCPCRKMWKFSEKRATKILYARALVLCCSNLYGLALHIKPSVERHEVVCLSRGPSTTFLRINEMRLHTFVLYLLVMKPPECRVKGCKCQDILFLVMNPSFANLYG